MTLFLSFIWLVIFISIGFWLNSNEWIRTSYIFYIFAGMCLVYPMNIFNLWRNKEHILDYNLNLVQSSSQENIQLTCNNCGINEVLVDINLRKNSKMFLSREAVYTNADGHVFPLICFNCDHINDLVESISPKKVRILKSYIINKVMKDRFLDELERYDNKQARTKVRNINIKGSFSLRNIIDTFLLLRFWCGVGLFALNYFWGK